MWLRPGEVRVERQQARLESRGGQSMWALVSHGKHLAAELPSFHLSPLTSVKPSLQPSPHLFLLLLCLCWSPEPLTNP